MRAMLAYALITAALSGCVGGSEDESPTVLGRALTFDARELTVDVGQTVTFRMVEASHTVDFAEGEATVEGISSSHSGHLNEGDTFTVTFAEPGQYAYFCQYHSSVSGGERVGMVGTITVV